MSPLFFVIFEVLLTFETSFFTFKPFLKSKNMAKFYFFTLFYIKKGDKFKYSEKLKKGRKILANENPDLLFRIKCYKIFVKHSGSKEFCVQTRAQNVSNKRRSSRIVSVNNNATLSRFRN